MSTLSLLPSLVVLGTAAVVAARLAVVRPSPPERRDARRLAARALAIAAAAQALHFLEEATTGFRTQLGDVFGLPAMSLSFFVVFNVVWLLVWVASVPAVRLGNALGFFAAWFLAIAGTLNGVLHPALAVGIGGYFPGLVSSPVIAAASLWLWVRLRRATAEGIPEALTSGP
jgi:hypothetical protein